MAYEAPENIVTEGGTGPFINRAWLNALSERRWRTVVEAMSEDEYVEYLRPAAEALSSAVPTPTRFAKSRYDMWGGPDSKKTYVYFIRAATGHIKIGTAKNPTLRLADLQVGNPMPLELIAAVEGSRAQERALHAEFAEHRSVREWFNPAPELLARIASFTPAKP